MLEFSKVNGAPGDPGVLLGNMANKLQSFLLESRREFQRVNWPTREEATRMVILVIVISLTVSVFLGALDFLNLYLLKQIIK